MAAAPVPAPLVHAVTMARRVEGTNAGADHDHRTALDTYAGLWVINSNTCNRSEDKCHG